MAPAVDSGERRIANGERGPENGERRTGRKGGAAPYRFQVWDSQELVLPVRNLLSPPPESCGRKVSYGFSAMHRLLTNRAPAVRTPKGFCRETAQVPGLSRTSTAMTLKSSHV